MAQIINGDPAPLRVVRHMAHLIVALKRGGQKQSSTCTATILSRRWLLTAAHCFFPGSGYTVSITDTYAFIGEASSTLRVGNTNKRPYYLSLYLTHKGFRAGTNDFRNDIALVFLDRSIARTQFHRVVISRRRRLDPVPKAVVLAAGYGVVDNQLTPSRRLQEAPLDIMPFGFCRDSTPSGLRGFLDDRRQICAVSSNSATGGPTDTCFGDSGGPLFIPKPSNQRSFQFAITSFATTFGCAKANTISWYTRVSFYGRVIRQGQKRNYASWNVVRK